MQEYIENFRFSGPHSVDIECPDFPRPNMTVKKLVLEAMGIFSRAQLNAQQDTAQGLQAILNMVPGFTFLWHKTRESLQCTNCGAVTASEVYNSFALVDIPDRSNTRPFSVTQCIQRHFTAAEAGIERLCVHCDGNVATKSTTLPQAPHFIMVQLKRFAQSRAGRLYKIGTDAIPFSELDIQTKEGPSTYEVVGSINHEGIEMSHGHYKAFIAHGSQWYLCDDQTITAIDSIENHPSQPTQSAYVLMLNLKN